MEEGATSAPAYTTPVMNTLVVAKQTSLSPETASNQGAQDAAMVGGPGDRELFSPAACATVTNGAG
eukprot:1732613-Pyramimonas_sp.AAC.1